ncbi:MAG: YwiC-like family protein [Candidatus Wallbacteria bacterium]|nr:YwiC-like family protein [Candidatus Wallbacteria bacterium]
MFRPDSHILSLTWPRQHGAWTILAASAALGFAVGGPVRVPTLFLATAVFCGFLGRQAAETWLGLARGDARRNAVAALYLLYLGLCITTGLAAAAHGLWFLLPIGAAGMSAAAASLLLGRLGRSASLAVDLVGLAGLGLVAPAFEYCTSGELTQRTAALWLLSTLFFAGRPFQVRFFTRHRAAQSSLSQRLRAGWPTLAYQSFALIAALGLAAATHAANPWLVSLAFLPVAALAAVSVMRGPGSPLPIWKIGCLEGLQALNFVVFAALALKLA